MGVAWTGRYHDAWHDEFVGAASLDVMLTAGSHSVLSLSRLHATCMQLIFPYDGASKTPL